MRQLLAVLLLSSPLLANGTIEVRGDRAGSIVLTRHAVTGTIRDQLAEITVEQAFLSRASQTVEGVYLFPLPPGASVAAFEMTVDGKTMRGEVVERERARRVYEDIVSRRRDPALLEKLDDETFRARVFPIDPAKDVSIRLTYQQLLEDHDGLIEFRYPLARQRLGAADVGRIDLRFDIESSIDVVSVTSPSHALKAETDGKRRAWLSLLGGADAQAKDLLLHVRRDPRQIGFTLLGDAERRTFLAILSPPTRLKDEEIPPRDLVYVVDASGSMKGGKIAQAKAALRRGVSLLRERDRFRILAFSTEVRPFRDGWADTSEESKRAALDWIDKLEANGGTAIDDALTRALEAGDPARLGLVVFLTDGLPTVGERDGKRIVANVKAGNPTAMRVFCFGVGFDQDVPFLDEIALSTRASREYVTEGQDLEATLVRFFDRVQQPALSDLRMEWGGGAREIYPHPLPDLFAGDRLVVAGRYENPGPCAVKLLGVRLGKPVEFVYEGSLPERGGVAAVARLWAQRKIDFLLAEIRRNGVNKELKDEVVRLATRHDIVTPYTAGLVVEDEAVPVEIVENEIDTDSEFVEEAIELDGLSDAPFAGPSTNSAIGTSRVFGIAGGAGGRATYRCRSATSNADNAVELHLKWLDSRRNDDTGAIGGVEDTSLALLAMLGAGYTDRGSERENRYAKCVRHALRFVIASQDDQGSFADRSKEGWLRTHAIATLAMSEAFRMTRSPRYKKPAQQALDLLGRYRTPGPAWDDDIVTTVWAVLALKSGKYAGLDVDPDGIAGARVHLEKRHASLTPTEQAAALLARILLGEDPRGSQPLKALADAVVANKPAWRDGEAVPLDVWHFGTMALFQFGGTHWKEWNEAMVEAIVERQRPRDAADLAGTWPIGGAGPAIGEQAKLAMCLEVYYRYDRVFGVR